VIGTKWVFKNNNGEDGEIVRNKARLVAQGFSQQGLNFGETFRSLCRIQGTQTLLDECEKCFPKWCHTGGGLCWTAPRFREPHRVYKLSKTLYGLKQAPRAWYARLKMFLLKHWYIMGSVDNILFTLKLGTDFLFRWLFSHSCVQILGNDGE
jgi:hypothetical protein